MDKILQVLLVIGSLVALPTAFYLFVRLKFRRYFGGSLGLFSLLRQAGGSDESYDKPLSVSGGTNIYLPKIKKDFPDFQYDIVAKKAEEFLIAYFEAREKRSIQPIKALEVTSALMKKIKFEINDLISKQKEYDIADVIFNGNSIWSYKKSSEAATITFQVSVGYAFTEFSDGRKIKNQVIQAKYEVDMSFIFKDSQQDRFALTCNNCGGPVKNTMTYCEFCGSGIVKNIEMVWRISGFKLLREYIWNKKS